MLWGTLPRVVGSVEVPFFRFFPLIEPVVVGELLVTGVFVMERLRVSHLDRSTSGTPAVNAYECCIRHVRLPTLTLSRDLVFVLTAATEPSSASRLRRFMCRVAAEII